MQNPSVYTNAVFKREYKFSKKFNHTNYKMSGSWSASLLRKWGDGSLFSMARIKMILQDVCMLDRSIYKVNSDDSVCWISLMGWCHNFDLPLSSLHFLFICKPSKMYSLSRLIRTHIRKSSSIFACWWQILSSADNLFYQFGPRQNVGPDLDPNWLTLWWYSWIFFRKCVSWRKKSADGQNGM